MYSTGSRLVKEPAHGVRRPLQRTLAVPAEGKTEKKYPLCMLLLLGWRSERRRNTDQVIFVGNDWLNYFLSKLA